MKISRLEWKVGLFVTIGLILLAGLLIEFSKGRTFFHSTYTLYLHADNAGSLKPRAQVLMSGVPIGTVADIELAPTGKYVVIPLSIYSRYKIYTDARFVIEQSGFLGDQYVAIIPTRNADGVYTNNAIAYTEAPFNLQEVARSASGFLQRIEQTAQQVNNSITDLQRLLLNERTLTNLAVAASNLRLVSERAMATVDGLHAVVASNAPAISLSGSNLVAFSDHLNQAGSTLETVLATNGPALQEAVKNIESSTAILKNLMNDVQAGKGVAGAVLHDQQLAANMSQIVYNLSVTTSNLNRAGLWGILWKHKEARPAPPSEHAPLASPKNTP
jgi:phospholipid/cholesterol/gamma-HCH transport system substrate-binding protein